MADTLSTISGVVQVVVGGIYEGTLSDWSFGRNRNLTQTGMANGGVAVGEGIAKGEFSFSRPMLKTSKGQQMPIEVLDGPVDIDIIFPGGDQQWRLPNARCGPWRVQGNPDAGNTSENFSGISEKPRRIK